MQLYNKNVRDALNKIGKESVDYLKKLLIAENKKATGELIKSLDYEVIKSLNGAVLLISAAKQFDYVDGGRRKGAKPPPVKPIELWVKHKGLKFKNMSERSMAFIIARSIGKKGIKPLHLKDKMIANIIDKKDDILANAAIKDIMVYLDNIFLET